LRVAAEAIFNIKYYLLHWKEIRNEEVWREEMSIPKKNRESFGVTSKFEKYNQGYL